MAPTMFSDMLLMSATALALSTAGALSTSERPIKLGVRSICLLVVGCDPVAKSPKRTNQI
jgi:hypothetical protein